MKRLISFLAAGFALQYALGGVSGCSSAAPDRQSTTNPNAKRGTLSMALQTVSESGKVYRLRNATFEVSSGFIFGGDVSGGGPVSVAPDAGFGIAGAAGSGTTPPGNPFPTFDGGIGGFNASGGFIGAGGFTAGAGGVISTGGSSFPGSSVQFLSSEDDPTAPVIERFLQPGSYDIDLFDGWFIEQVDNLLGTSAPVPATLLSSSFQFFDITSDQETFVKFDFEVDGSRVTFGPPGRLIVGIGIHETNGNQAFCGDGIRENMEACDGADFGFNTCATVTMGSAPFGSLFCTKDCNFDTSFCSGGFDGGTGGTGGFGGGTGGLGTGGGIVFPPADGGVVGPSGGGGTAGKPAIP
jgi:hypothetical protein